MAESHSILKAERRFPKAMREGTLSKMARLSLNVEYVPIAATVAERFRLCLNQSVIEESIAANGGTAADRTYFFALAQSFRTPVVGGRICSAALLNMRSAGCDLQWIF